MLANRRLPHTAALLSACTLAFTPPVDAGCLCNLLFGRPPAHAAASVPIAAPVYSAAMPLQGNAMPAYAAAMPATAGPMIASHPAPIAPLVNLGTTTGYAAQMPAYGSVTPMPGGFAGQHSSLYRGTQTTTASPITSFYGTGNIYPQAPTTPQHFAGMAGHPAVQPTSAVASGEPVFQPARRGLLGWLFGRNYRSNYYMAPVTYYRPQTTLDPATGATMTVQQACTDYQYQMQRSPYVGLQPSNLGTGNHCAPTQGVVQPFPGTTQPVPTYGPPVAPGAVPQSQFGAQPQAGGFSSPEGFVPQPTLPPSQFDPYAVQSPPATSTFTPAPPSFSPTTAPDPAPQHFAPQDTWSGPSSQAGPLVGPPTTDSGVEQSAPVPLNNGSPGSYYQQYNDGRSHGQNGQNGGLRDLQPVERPELNGNGPNGNGLNVPPLPAAPVQSGWNSSASSSSSTSPNSRDQYAAPIPASTPDWEPAEYSDYDPSSGGRTAAAPHWNFKQISWSEPAEPLDHWQSAKPTTSSGLHRGGSPARSQTIAEPSSTPRQEPSLPPNAEADHRQRPAWPVRSNNQRNQYDNSGWRAAR